MRLAEAWLERHAPGGSMPSEAPKHCKIQSRRDAPKMAIPCAQNAPGRSTMRLPEALLPRNPTWESPHFSGLTNRFRTFSAIGPYLALTRIHTQASVLNRLILKPLRGLNRAILVVLLCLQPLKKSAKQKRDRGRDSQLRPSPRWNSQPQGATKLEHERWKAGAMPVNTFDPLQTGESRAM